MSPVDIWFFRHYKFVYRFPFAERRNILSALMARLGDLPFKRMLLQAEYGVNRGIHPLHRFTFLRWTMESLELFLRGFWYDDLHAQLQEYATSRNKSLQLVGETALFGGFYRVMEYHA